MSMQNKSFEDLLVWSKSRDFVKVIYITFQDNRNYYFKDQILRATLSIMNNIAEGYERDSDKDFRRFLYMAKGSVAEVRSMLYVASDLTFVSRGEFDRLYKQSLEISKMLGGFIKKLN